MNTKPLHSLLGCCSLLFLATACSSPARLLHRALPPSSSSTPEVSRGDPCQSTGTAGTAFTEGINCRTMTVDGYDRSYIVYVPAGYSFTEDDPAPVVFMFHGTSGTGEKFLRISGWREKADEVGLIAVFPTSLRYHVLESGRINTKWNAYDLPDEVDLDVRPPDYPEDAPWPADDVKFVREMIEDLHDVAQIDERRVYASGFSNGAGFTARLAVEMTDDIAAFAYTGGGSLAAGGPIPDGQTPRSVFMVLGAADAKILESLADSGTAALTSLPLAPDGLLAIPKIASMLEASVETLQLAWEPYNVKENGRATDFRWKTPADSSTVFNNSFQFAVLRGLEHRYPNGKNNPGGFVAADRFWSFFENHPTR